MGRQPLPLRPRPEPLLFGFLLAVHLLPVWFFEYIPTQDGPAHLSLTNLLRFYDRPEGAFLREYFLPNREAIPNWFIFLVLGKLLAFLPVPVAEKVLVSAYVVLLPVSVRYALTALDGTGRSRFLALLAFPFVYSFLFWMGFYNFCFSLAAFFFSVGFWLRRPDRPGPARTAGLALLVLWVYFCHPVTLVVTVAALGTLVAWRVLLDRGSEPLGRSLRRWLAAPILACLPALLFLATFVGTRMRGVGDREFAIQAKIDSLNHLVSLVALDCGAETGTTLLAWLFVFLAAWRVWRLARERRAAPADGLLLVAVLCVLIYFVAPDRMSGGSFIRPRLNLFPFLALLLWLGGCEYPPRLRQGIQVAAVVLSLYLLGTVWGRWAELDRYLAEYASAGRRIEPGSTLLALSFAHSGRATDGRELACRTWPFMHAQGQIAARKPLVDLALYAADTDHFPFYFRPDRNPFKLLATDPRGLYEEPPRVDFATYAERTGGRVDYVLLWSPLPKNYPAAQSVLRQLDGYERVYTSPRRLVHLYRRRPAG